MPTTSRTLRDNIAESIRLQGLSCPFLSTAVQYSSYFSALIAFSSFKQFPILLSPIDFKCPVHRRRIFLSPQPKKETAKCTHIPSTFSNQNQATFEFSEIPSLRLTRSLPEISSAMMFLRNASVAEFAGRIVRAHSAVRDSKTISQQTSLRIDTSSCREGGGY